MRCYIDVLVVQHRPAETLELLLDVRPHLRYPLRTKMRRREVMSLAHGLLSVLGLEGAEHLLPSELSGGMKKRAGIARAMALDPAFLFFDEPSAGLDPVTAAGLDELIIRLNRAFRMTIVVVTHELPSVFMIADYIIMLDAGKVIFQGTLDDLRASGNERIQMFLQRKPEKDTYTPEDLFRIIAGD